MNREATVIRNEQLRSAPGCSGLPAGAESEGTVTVNVVGAN